MTLKTTANLQEFLYTYACGDSIRRALAVIGGSSENTIANWLRASRKSGPEEWIVTWPPNSDQQMKFHDAFEDARRWSLKLRQSEMRQDLELRLEAIRMNGPRHPKPEAALSGLPAEWEPQEQTGRGGPEPEPPKSIAEHPRAYTVPPLHPPQCQDYHRAASLDRPGIGNAEPDPEGRFSMSQRDGIRREYSLQERRAGKPRITDRGIIHE